MVFFTSAKFKMRWNMSYRTGMFTTPTTKCLDRVVNSYSMSSENPGAQPRPVGYTESAKYKIVKDA